MTCVWISLYEVIKTLIYGVRSSGSLAERGLRLTAEMTLYPRACDIMNDIYIDDCLSGENYENALISTG